MSSQNSNIGLRELQSWMRWIITDPRGVSDALANPKPAVEKYANRYQSPVPSALSSISSSDVLSPETRLSIYAEAYFLRILEALETDFRRLRLIMGEVDFQQVVAEYLKAYPSVSFNIGEVGRRLPQFLRENDFDSVFTAIAEFELNVLETFYADSLSPVEPHAFSELDENQWARLKLQINPSARVLKTKWSLDDFWNLDSEKSKPEFKPSDRDRSFLLWRHNFQVRLVGITEAEASALKHIQSGTGLAEALDKTAEDQTDSKDMNVLSQEVMAAFGRWIQDGLISGIKIETT